MSSNISRWGWGGGSSCLPLSDKLKTKAIINIQNDEDIECFRWCHLAYLFPVGKNAHRISNYKMCLDTVNYNGIKFPVKLKDIPKIEKLNDIKSNVHHVLEEKPEIIPRCISKKICDKT